MSQVYNPEVESMAEIERLEHLGVIDERSLLERVFRRPETVEAAVETVMGDALPLVEADDDVESLFPVFMYGGSGAVATRDGAAIGVITRSDLLEFVAHQRAGQDGETQ